MVGGGFDGFHFGGVFGRKAGNHGINFGQGGSGKRRHFANFGRGSQRFEPFQLHAHAGADQAVFGKNGAQGFNGGGIAAVERGKGKQGRHVVSYEKKANKTAVFYPKSEKAT